MFIDRNCQMQAKKQQGHQVLEALKERELMESGGQSTG